MNEPRFYGSEECSTLIEVLCADPKASFSCCQKELTELKANTSDGASEKHLPVVEQNGNVVTVNVGSIAHPMTEEHSIGFICLETEKGLQRVRLKADGDPKALPSQRATNRWQPMRTATCTDSGRQKSVRTIRIYRIPDKRNSGSKGVKTF